MDDLYADYDPKSVSGRMDGVFCVESARRITLPLSDDLQTSFPPGLPKYDPSSMPYPTFYEFNLKPTYVPPLSYYVLNALKPHYASISPLDELLSSRVSVGTERVSIVDSLLPYAKHSMDYVDPPTWAILIQIFDGLPERCFRYTLALNDPHLSTLATIPSTPNFSVVTFLDLSGSNELSDRNISFLKGLTSLCVFDTSCTKLTDQGIKNFKSTLFLREPGPIYLRSWSLRECEGITAKVLGSLLAFPLLCVLDLRRTSIQPSQVKAAFWPRDTLLPVSENVEYFAPYPQHRIPELLQQLDKSSFLHSQAGSDAKYPYVIHIDRIRPESHCHSRSRGSAGVSRIAQNVYHVSDTYVQPSDREERNRSQYERPQWHSKANYADDYCTSDEPDWWTEYEYPSDSEDVQSMNEDDSRSERSSTSSSKDSFDSAESPGIASPISQSHLPPSAIGVCTSRSPPPLTPNLFVDNAPPQGSVASHASLHEPTQDGICTINSENQANVSSSQIPSLSTTNGQPTNDSLESLSGSSSNDSLVDVLEYESGNAKRAITGFFNPRVQAGLAPPKRKRGHRYSSESSKSNDSEGNLEGDHKKQRTILSSLGNVELLLLRRPPSWSTAQKLVAARQKIKASAGFQSRDQSGTNKSVLGSAQLAKKKESILDGGRAAWNRIKESSSKKSLSPSSIANLKAITSPSAISQSQASPSVTLSQPLSAQDKSTRRTTIGRPPKAPGTVVWKLN